MIPISVSARASRTAWVNLSLITVNVLAFLYELSLGPAVEPFLDRWGVVPARVAPELAGASHPELAVLATLLTAAFLHAGWLHLGGNMLFLWVFGANVEDHLGHGRYVLFYLICGLAANVAQVEVDPTSTIAAIGASGAIAGVLGAFAVTFPGARVSVLVPVLLFWVLEVPALVMIGIWFATQFFSGVASLTASAQSSGIAWWAHVGGFGCGVVLMLLLPKSAQRVTARRFENPSEQARADTGLVGLLTGCVSLAAQLIEIGLGIRIVTAFLGQVNLGELNQPIAEIVQLTTPIVGPFAVYFPTLDLAGHPFELDALVAIICVYLLGSVVTWTIAALSFGGDNYR